MEGGSTQLLPTHYQPSPPVNPAKIGRDAASKTGVGRVRLADVWDEREELFDIGEASDEDEEGSRGHNFTPRATETPKIVVTGLVS